VPGFRSSGYSAAQLNEKRSFRPYGGGIGDGKKGGERIREKEIDGRSTALIGESVNVD